MKCLNVTKIWENFRTIHSVLYQNKILYRIYIFTFGQRKRTGFGTRNYIISLRFRTVSSTPVASRPKKSGRALWKRPGFKNTKCEENSLGFPDLVWPNKICKCIFWCTIFEMITSLEPWMMVGGFVGWFTFRSHGKKPSFWGKFAPGEPKLKTFKMVWEKYHKIKFQMCPSHLPHEAHIGSLVPWP